MANQNRNGAQRGARAQDPESHALPTELAGYVETIRL